LELSESIRAATAASSAFHQPHAERGLCHLRAQPSSGIRRRRHIHVFTGGWLSFLGVGILFCAVPWLARREGDEPPSYFYWHWSPIWLLIFTGAAFFFRYRVVVRDQTLTYGAFRRRAIPFSEVIDYDVIKGQRSAELWVYLKSGKHLTFSGLLGDFDELVGMVNSHMAGLPGPQHDSVAKIRNREKRQRGNRVANVLSAVGVLIVAAFVFILWRMQLLH
jgi:hypothetical protein